MIELSGFYAGTSIRLATDQPGSHAPCLVVNVIGQAEFFDDRTLAIPGREALLSRDGVRALRDHCNRFLDEGHVS